MDKFVIRILGYAAPGFICHESGQYIKDFNPVGKNGHLITATRREDAKQFDSPADAMTFYRQVSTDHPTRPDGRSNRPLTAYTIEVSKLVPMPPAPSPQPTNQTGPRP